MGDSFVSFLHRGLEATQGSLDPGLSVSNLATGVKDAGDLALFEAGNL